MEWVFLGRPVLSFIFINGIKPKISVSLQQGLKYKEKSNICMKNMINSKKMIQWSLHAFLLNGRKNSQGKELLGKDLITWTFECVQKLKKDEMEAYTWARWSLYHLQKSLLPHPHKRTFLITENI